FAATKPRLDGWRGPDELEPSLATRWRWRHCPLTTTVAERWSPNARYHLTAPLRLRHRSGFERPDVSRGFVLVCWLDAVRVLASAAAVRPTETGLAEHAR